jgi:hypothetical protein
MEEAKVWGGEYSGSSVFYICLLLIADLLHSPRSYGTSLSSCSRTPVAHHDISTQPRTQMPRICSTVYMVGKKCERVGWRGEEFQ